jgi:hypothetical protein
MLRKEPYMIRPLLYPIALLLFACNLPTYAKHYLAILPLYQASANVIKLGLDQQSSALIHASYDTNQPVAHQLTNLLSQYRVNSNDTFESVVPDSPVMQKITAQNNEYHVYYIIIPTAKTSDFKTSVQWHNWDTQTSFDPLRAHAAINQAFNASRTTVLKYLKHILIEKKYFVVPYFREDKKITLITVNYSTSSTARMRFAEIRPYKTFQFGNSKNRVTTHTLDDRDFIFLPMKPSDAKLFLKKINPFITHTTSIEPLRLQPQSSYSTSIAALFERGVKRRNKRTPAPIQQIIITILQSRKQTNFTLPEGAASPTVLQQILDSHEKFMAQFAPVVIPKIEKPPVVVPPPPLPIVPPATPVVQPPTTPIQPQVPVPTLPVTQPQVPVPPADVTSPDDDDEELGEYGPEPKPRSALQQAVASLFKGKLPIIGSKRTPTSARKRLTGLKK